MSVDNIARLFGHVGGGQVINKNMYGLGVGIRSDSGIYGLSCNEGCGHPL